MAEVILKNITKFYGSNAAIKNFNLTIADKEFCVLVGPSGCGKSTVLRIVSGLLKFDSGEIVIDNIPVNDVPPKDRNIAMVFQNYSLYPHMNVFENIAFPLKMRKTPKSEITGRVNATAEILNITALLKKKPKYLSGGEKQRVAIGRAIVRNPKLFLFDEPLSNLDVRLRDEMRTEIKRLHEKLKTTILYVTHEQSEAMMLADKICVMKPVTADFDGTVQQTDTPLNIYRHPKNSFIAEFMGYPKINMLELNIVKQGNSRVLTDNNHITIILEKALYPGLEQYTGNKILLGARPEDIVLSDVTNKSGINNIPVKVEIISLVGSDLYIHVKLENQVLIFRTNNANYLQLKPGQFINISINLDKIHLFDNVTGNTILPVS